MSKKKPSVFVGFGYRSGFRMYLAGGNKFEAD